MALDKLVDSAQLDADLTTVANAIRTRGGTSDALSFPSGMASAVLAIPSGGGGGGTTGFVYPKDINFYDYDGILLESWTLAELQTKTALPDYPTHAGLISQGWNWTLEALKTTNRKMNVGATYVTDDGSTRLYITIDVLGRTTMPLYFSQTVTNDVVIDWGDGSATETVEGTGAVNTSHTYTSVGDFVIKLKSTTGTMTLGDTTNSKNIFGINYETESSKRYLLGRLKKVELNNSVILKIAFMGCWYLSSLLLSKGLTSNNFSSEPFSSAIPKFIVIPSSFENIRSNMFDECYLEGISLPNSVKKIGISAFRSSRCKEITLPNLLTDQNDAIDDYAFSQNSYLENFFIPTIKYVMQHSFNQCHRLQKVVISEGIEGIATQSFYNDYSLTNITIPSTVRFISQDAFRFCLAMKEYHFKSTTPPSLSSTTSLTVPEDCIIYVPQGCAEAYKAATNWATYADKIMEETTV